MTELQITEPGIYPHVTWDEYRALPFLNHSTLAWGTISMLHLRWALEGRLETKDSAALKFGRALHLRLLEPELFKERFTVIPEFGDLRKTDNKKKKVEWESRLDGKEFIDRDDAERIEFAALAIKNHPAEFLRTSTGHFECAVIADILGERCKARLDKLIEHPHLTIVDVKKVGSATSPSEGMGQAQKFARRIPLGSGYGYGMQAAFYCDMVKAVFGGLPRYYWIVVEDGPPYAVGVYRASEELIQAGRMEYTDLIVKMRQCRDTGVWSGYTEEVETIYGPEWWNQLYGGM